MFDFAIIAQSAVTYADGTTDLFVFRCGCFLAWPSGTLMRWCGHYHHGAWARQGIMRRRDG